jgi:hypothetical protein
MQELRSFLVDDRSALLELDVRAEQEPRAAKLLDAVTAEHDDLVIALEPAWTTAEALCTAIAAELADRVSQAKEVFGEDESPRFAFPSEPENTSDRPLT